MMNENHGSKYYVPYFLTRDDRDGAQLDQEYADHTAWQSAVPEPAAEDRAWEAEQNATEDRSSAAYETIRTARGKGDLGLISSAVAWAIANDLYPRD